MNRYNVKRGIPIPVILLIVVFVVSLIGIIYWLVRDTSTEQAYESLSQYIASDDLEDIDDETLYETHKKLEYENIDGVMVQKKFAELYKQNSDFVGWIKINDTHIDYPVCQHTSDNEYYLTHNFEKEVRSSGCIYLDTLCTLDGTNMLLHGHHMRSGIMFKDLLKYQEEDFYKSHNYFRFDTITENGRYEVIAAFYSKVYDEGDSSFHYYEFYQANNQQEFDTYVGNIKKLALYDTGVSATYGERLLTLSTCAYHTENGRFVVVAKKVW